MDDYLKNRDSSRNRLSRRQERRHGILRVGIQATYAELSTVGRSPVASGYSYHY
jgi:uncharacterized glyoxalase superfamily metalloenzyme YdcJ